jgi:predicted ATPase
MLDGFEIAGYRSFGHPGIQISDMSRMNVFIGKNNSGKSNILRFISLLAEKSPRIDPLLDYCLGDTMKEISFGIQIKSGGFTDKLFQAIREPFGDLWDETFPENKTSMWFRFKVSEQKEPLKESVESLAGMILKRCSPEYTEQLTSRLCHYRGGSKEGRAHDISQVLHGIVKLDLKISTIEAFRRISEPGGQVLSGSGLINELRKLQSPDLAQYDAGKKRFARINLFLESLLAVKAARLEIPAEKDEIYVTLDNTVLPLGSLGTGIHELIIMAASVTLADDCIFCIEEPEIHFHPDLQKKFIRYINENTSNQYVISTHSNALFDLPDLNLYQVRLLDGRTKCELLSTAQDKFYVLQDLGYRPSDLLQANYVIWVEGPSDRVYINNWIKTKAPDLIEGVHYAVMFYGGRLLAHLSYDDDRAVDDFIKLSRLNRGACIVMDSDRRTLRSRLNATKQRVNAEFRESGRFVWITKGRTIENYISWSTLDQAITKVHPKATKRPKWERYADMTRISANASIDKVAVARAVASHAPDFGILDLESIVYKLIADIRKHNS